MTFIPYSQLTIAIAGYKETPHDWFPATQVSPFIFDDPGLVWLEHHGENHGFLPDESPYEFLDFIADIGHKFEQKWLREMAPGAQVVCFSPTEARDSQKVRLTIELMQRGAPVIYQPALWWAPERVYGAPDLLMHTNWLRDKFPDLVENASSQTSATNLGQAGELGHYVVIDLKFTTGLDQSRKGVDLECYTAQVRIYNFMLGQLQGYMPEYAYLIARDRLANPLPVKMHSSLSEPLDADLASMRDLYVEIKLNGERYRPWVDEIVAINLDHTDDLWRSAKCEIAQDLTPGGDTSLMYYVGQRTKRQLAEFGYPNLESLLNTDPENIPFEECKGIGSKTAGQMRAILKTNQSGSPVTPPKKLVPKKRPYEFFVDYEYFTNVNVDFDTQWPNLEGQEMIFMVGIGWIVEGAWQFTALIAESESLQAERQLLDRFCEWLRTETDGTLNDRGQTALYHWSNAEVWQSRRAADRHQLQENHALRNLPWVDLSKVFSDGPGAMPGSWGFGLKEMTRGLGEYDPAYAVHWPGELDEGLRVMVMGWEAYQSTVPTQTAELNTIHAYLDADCKALWAILGWLRDQ